MAYFITGLILGLLLGLYIGNRTVRTKVARAITRLREKQNENRRIRK